MDIRADLLLLPFGLFKDGRGLFNDTLCDTDRFGEVAFLYGLYRLLLQLLQYAQHPLATAGGEAPVGFAHAIDGAFQQLSILFPRVNMRHSRGKTRFQVDGEIAVGPRIFPYKFD